MQKIVVYWRDIPAQVIIKRGRTRGKAGLALRFQEGIDRAAMRAGKGGSDEYLSDWRRDSASFQGPGDLQELARHEALQIESDYDDERLAQLVANNGVAVE
jgi:hypothetical protein